MPIHAITRGDAAVAMCKELGVAPTLRRRHFFLAWYAGENTQARFNPCATEFFLPGSTDFNSVGVRNYATWAQGLEGWLDTISLHYYDDLRKAIRFSAPFAREARMMQALTRAPWGTFRNNLPGGIAALKYVRRNLASESAKLIGQ